MMGVPTTFTAAVFETEHWKEIRTLRKRLIVQISTLGFDLSTYHITNLLPVSRDSLNQQDLTHLKAYPRAPGHFDIRVALIWNYTSVAEKTVPVEIIRPSRSYRRADSLEPDGNEESESAINRWRHA